MEFNLINPIAERKTKTVYRDGDKTIKLFVENYSKADILNEALIQSRVEENTDLKISRLQEVTKINERWALITEYVEGTPLDVLMKEHPEKFEDIYIYDVTDDSRVLLKKWSIGEREQPGKQLYRLSDSELMVHHEHGWGEVFIMYDYIFIVKPEDIGL